MGLKSILASLFVICMLGIVCHPSSLFALQYKTKYAHCRVKTWDGYLLDVDVYSPGSGSGFPLVIFSPSWGVGKIEYMIPAMRMAQKGYVAVSYSARGWSKSTGTVNIGEENDMRDVSSIIDFILANYPVDGSKIGMAGISMGGERSLTIPIHEKRIRAVAALSCTADYHENLYKNNTPNIAHAFSGEPTTFADIIEGLIDGADIGSLINWMYMMSPSTRLDDYNSLIDPPGIYISNGYDDALMDNNSLLSFFDDLDFPEKVIDFNDGKHAFPVGTGCVGLPERTWTKVYEWFDYYLKGMSSGIVDRIHKKRIGLQLKGTSERLYFDSWPSRQILKQNFYLHPRQDCPTNYDNMESGMNAFPYKSNSIDTIYSGTGSAASLASYDDMSELNLSPQTCNIIKLNGRYAMVYETTPFDRESLIAGIPVLMLGITPSMPDAQIIAHLYDVNPLGKGTLLTHCAWTLRNVTAGRKVRLNFEFNILAYRMPKHHRLALVLDTYDKRFGFPDRPAYNIGIDYDDIPLLTIPYTYVKPVYEPVQ